MNDEKTTVYILLGANLGDRERNLAFALGKLELIPGLDITATSGIGTPLDPAYWDSIP